MRGQAVLNSSANVHHCTPLAVLEPVRLLGPIGLDPCSNPCSIVGALVEWRRGGLHRDWRGFGNVYCNPPYGRRIHEWTERCVETAYGPAGENVIGLLPARSDRRLMQRDLARAVAVCFWRGRIKFLGTKSGAPFPSVLVFWGDRTFGHRARAIFAPYGWMP